jgi:hypothetical protein
MQKEAFNAIKYFWDKNLIKKSKLSQIILKILRPN